MANVQDDTIDGGYKVSVSISMPANMLFMIREVMPQFNRKQSGMITHMIKLGFIYLHILEEQAESRKAESIASAEQKEPKPKTPSKKKKK